jgi:glycosyltransferase involved in cell wall biosynthesis
MDTLLFTIFTPTYNRAYKLPRLYLSLQEQTVKNFEWLIIDDGSTDHTMEVVSEWQKSKDNGFQIRYIRKENAGKPRAINDASQIANGKYIQIMDSDDYLTPDAMQMGFRD